MPDCTVPSQPNSQHLTMDCLNISSYSSTTELTEAAVDSALNYLQGLLNTQAKVSVILATGNSQLQFLDRLVHRQLDWSRVVFFHLDEYLGISGSHQGSFRYYLQQKVANKISDCNKRVFIKESLKETKIMG